MGAVHTALDDSGRVAVLTLAGDTAMNAFDVAMRDDLLAALRLCRAHPDVGAVFVRAAGPNFSAGADVREFRGPESVVVRRWIRARRDVWRDLWELPIPVVVAMRGYVYGSGFELALLADIRVAAPDATFCLPETRLGMLPAAAGTQSLTRTVGAATALELITTARAIDATTAHELGVVHRVTAEPDELGADLAARLAALPRPLTAAAKRALHAAVDPVPPCGATVERRAAAMARAVR